ncbi:MAG: SDR family NAD(P)-dependent oxidoreductase [Verrucomicrobiota bacterium]
MQNVLITGASSGIGLVTAKHLLNLGYKVYGTSRSLERLESIQGLQAIEMDLCSDASIASGWEKIEKAGGVDLVINNAGAGYIGSIEKMSLDEERRLFQILVHGPMLLNRKVVSFFRKQGFGLLINVTSVAGILPIPFMSCYSSAKAAFIAYTSALRIETAGDSFRVVDLRPGDIRTSFNEAMTKGLEDSFYQDKLTKAWQVIDKNLKEAPDPLCVAQKIEQIIQDKGAQEVYYVGDFFQTRIAPFLLRFASSKLVTRAILAYYKLD